MTKRQPPWRGTVISAASVLIAVCVWEGVCRAQLVNPVLLRPPSAIVRSLPPLLGDSGFRYDLFLTLRNYLVSLAIATVGGGVLGVAMGTSTLFYHVLHPFVVTLNALPKIVLMPLVVLWLGVGAPAGIFLGTMMAGFPILTACYTGTRLLHRDLVLLARSFGASRTLTQRTIVIPGIAPFILSGLRVGVTYGMVGVLIAEFFASSHGLGYRMVAAMANFEVDTFFVCMALVAAITLSIVSSVQSLEGRLGRWRL